MDTNNYLEAMSSRVSLANEGFRKKVGKVAGVDVLVMMNEGEYAEGEKTIGTACLGGCLATLIYAEGEKRRGIVTHYFPIHSIEHSDRIEELIREHPEMCTSPVKRGVVLYPEGYMNPNESEVELLEITIKLALGADTRVDFLSYSLLKKKALLSLDSLGCAPILSGDAVLDLREGIEKRFYGNKIMRAF